MWRKRCQLCLRTSPRALCSACWQQIPFLNTEQHSFLLSPGHPHIAYAPYIPPLKQILYLVKYQQASELAYVLGQFLGEWYQLHYPLPDMIVPIPLHADKLKQRGFNQAAQLGKGLSDQLRKPCVDGLIRQKETPPLYELNPQQRHEVLREAFTLNSKVSLQDLRVLIVDDILTTGSTLLSAIDCLKPSTERIVSLTLARALLDRES